ncbi:nitrile hydratase subunit alpha, partial [Rhizobium johnstonii]
YFRLTLGAVAFDEILNDPIVDLLVAGAWLDPAFKDRLVANNPAAIAELDLPEGMAGAEGEHMRAVANSAEVHNLII